MMYNQGGFKKKVGAVRRTTNDHRDRSSTQGVQKADGKIFKDGVALDIPPLIYGFKSNIIAWLRTLKAKLAEKFGDLADIVDLDDYPTYELPQPDPELLQNDPQGLYLEDIKERRRLARRAEDALMNNRSKAFGFMMLHLSPESEQKVKESENWENIAAVKDPLQLLRIIKQSHVGLRTGFDLLDIENARKAYTTVSQYENETLIQYRDRFEMLIDGLVGLGDPEPEESHKAVRFILGLDKLRYSELKSIYVRNARMNIGEFPQTLAAAFTSASNHVQTTLRKSNGAGQGVAYTAQAKRESKPTSSLGPCYGCGQFGHLLRNCPDAKREANELLAEGKPPVKTVAAATTSSNSDSGSKGHGKQKKTFITIVNAFSDSRELEKFTVVLDTGATAAVVRDKSLLTNIRQADYEVSIKGVNGKFLHTSLVGDLPLKLGKAFYHPDVTINLIPLGMLESKFTVVYLPGVKFEVTLDSGDKLNFLKESCDDLGNGLYIADFKEFIHPENYASIATVSENEHDYSQRERKDALRAREFMAKAGYPSVKDAIELIESGAITDCPVTVHDIIRAEKIYGPDVAVIKGKSVHRKTDPVNTEFIPKPIRARQTLSADIMFNDGQPTLITVSHPLGLIMARDLDGNRNTENLGNALVSMIKEYQSEGFYVDYVLCDGEGGVAASKELLNAMGVVLNTTTSEEHVPRIERTIRTVKERMRAIITTLPYRLPTKLMKYLIDFVVMHLNMFPRTTSESRISSREYFTGRKLNFKRDFRIKFGEYALVEVNNVVKNDARNPRAEGAIALLSTGNIQGSVYFYLLSTGKVVARDNFKILPMPQEVIHHLNKLDGRDSRSSKDIRINYDYEAEDEEANDEYFERLLAQVEPTRVRLAQRTSGLDLIEQDSVEDNESIEDEDQTIEEVESQVQSTEEEQQSTPSYNLRTDPKKTDKLILHFQKKVERYLLHMSVKECLTKHKNATLKAVFKELKQMVDMNVFEPLSPLTLSKTQLKKTIRSFMFMKEKYKSDGCFDKLKARLVSGGNMQKLFGGFLDVSSPTASLPAVFMIAAIAAKESRKVATSDVPGAYLHTEMTDEVIMLIDSIMAELLIILVPDWERFLDAKGRIYVKLKKAMYGCIQSAKLWYENIASILKEEGFIVNPVEMCIFNKDFGEVQCTVCLYVDDLMITCKDEKVLNEVINKLTGRFEGMKAEMGNIHSYLGMTFNFGTKGQVSITMEGYIQEILKYAEVEGTVKTPATPNLFEIEEGATILNDDKKTEFHSRVAKLMYLAKRVRPDILVPVAFLATRISCATESDWKRLDRIFKYLNGEPNLGIVLKPGDGDLTLNAYADASYGVHEDGKSQSGLCIALGEGPIFVRSAKQKIVSKSSTEAELISLSDGCSQIIWSRDFLINQGYDIGSATVYQDNKSTMSLVEKGRSNSDRTRHIHVRYYFIKDRVESGEVKIQYLQTDEMVADILTKPLIGQRFIDLRNKLLNWYY